MGHRGCRLHLSLDLRLMPDFNIALFSRSLGSEISEILAGGLNDLGHACRIQMFTLEPSCINIVLPAVLFPSDALDRVPPSTIFYNVEGLQHLTQANQSAMIEILKRGLPVWDFGRENFAWYEAAGFGGAPAYLPLGYSSAIDRLARLPWEERTIDVMFFGRLSQRRLDILARLMASSLSIGIFANLYGEGRDDLISRAKVIVDIPTVTPFVAENPRLTFCASNRKLCVSELPAYPLDPRWSDAVAFVAFEEIVSTCEGLARNRDVALAREEQAYEAMRSMPMADLLGAALAGTAPRLPAPIAAA